MTNTEYNGENGLEEYVSIFDRKPTNLEWVLQDLDYSSWRAQRIDKNEEEPERFSKRIKPEVTPERFGERMNVEDLVAVHLTKYFPEKGTLKSLNTVFPEDHLRNTVHFSINHPVEDIACFGNWKDTKYAIVTPLEKLCREENNQVNNFNVVDTYFVGDVKLPTEATVLVSPNAYEDAIERNIISRDLLMTHIYSTIDPFTQLAIEKDNLRYVILGPNSNLRGETYKEIARQGYLCMGGGSWNWGGIGSRDGADMKDQRRIANQIGAENVGPHSGGNMYELESIGMNILADRATEEGALDLLLPRSRDYSDERISAFEYLERHKAEVPVSCHPRIDRFIATNLEIVKKQLSPQTIHDYDLGYLFENDLQKFGNSQ